MDYMNYKTIQVIKKSERTEVLFASIEGMEQPVVVKRLTEANPEVYRVVAGVQSPHIPTIFQVEEREDALYVVEEYVDGRTLSTYLEEEKLADEQKLELMLQLCDAMEILHECIPPVIHRDIKPSNILITPEGVLKLIDFDAARQYKTEKNTGDTRLLGTIEYAAPEQFGYSQTDLRSDIYSIGVVFSEIKIGKDVCFAKEWKRLVDKCTSFDPENRYKTVAELKKDLLRCIGKAKKGRCFLYPTIIGIAMLFLLAIGLLLSRSAEEEAANITPTMQAEQTTNVPEPTEKIDKQKRIVGERTETVGYLISAMDYVKSSGLTHRLNDSGSVSLQFEKIYGSIIYELPDVIDMNYCVDVMARIKNEVGDIAIILYDENCHAVETLYAGKTEGSEEVFFSPKYKGKVGYVGFMANDGELEDYSGFATTVYYVDFMVINPDTPKISYTMAELAEENYYFMERTYNEDGSVTMDFERLYGELFLRFPQEIDLRHCVGIGVVMESEVGDLTVNFFDKELEHVESFYDYTTDGVKEKLFNPLSGAMIGAMGLMIDDQELEDFSDCEATVYAVNFYMEEGYIGSGEIAVLTKEPTKIEGVALKEDRLAWTNETLPVTVKLWESEQCTIDSLYVCEQADPEEPFSETITEVSTELYQVSEDGLELRLGTMFFGSYNYPEELSLYVEFSNGRGERVWLTQGEILSVENIDSTVNGTERFTYEIMAGNQIVLTGLTEEAKADKRNRMLVLPGTINNMPVVEIAEGAFAGVPLTFVSLPEKLRTIGRGAFYGCNLMSVTIPASVTYVAPRAFGANHGMTEILVAEGNRKYSSRIGVLYNINKTVLHQIPANFAGPKFTIPDSVIDIKEYAFGNCRNLTGIYGDTTVHWFGKDAYWNTPATMKKKEVVGTESGIAYYTFDMLDLADFYDLSYQLNDNNAISVQFDKMYGELIMALYETVDMQYCTGIKLNLKNETGNIVVKLYDENLNEVESISVQKAEGEQLIAYTPAYRGQIAYIGFMANDRNLFDYSEFETILYYLRFEFVLTENMPRITYTAAELPCTRQYGVECKAGEAGSLIFSFEERWGAYFQEFPEPIDMSRCSGVKILLKNEDASISFTLLDENGEKLEAFYNYKTSGVQEVELFPKETKMVYGIRYMTDDENESVYDNDETIIYSMTFYMKE